MAAGKSPHPPAWSRRLRRIWEPFLNEADKERIAAAISEAERHTTGRIHVEVIASSGGRDMLELARIRFRTRGLDHAPEHNAVLILISHLDHRFSFWGGSGIHDRIGPSFWEKAKQILVENFQERRYPEGIAACVQELGRELTRHFPKMPDKK